MDGVSSPGDFHAIEPELYDSIEYTEIAALFLEDPDNKEVLAVYKEIYKREHAVKHQEFTKEFGEDYWLESSVKMDIIEGVKAEVSTKRLADIDARSSSKGSDRRNRRRDGESELSIGGEAEDSEAQAEDSEAQGAAEDSQVSNTDGVEQSADMDLDMDIQRAIAASTALANGGEGEGESNNENATAMAVDGGSSSSSSSSSAVARIAVAEGENRDSRANSKKSVGSSKMSELDLSELSEASRKIGIQAMKAIETFTPEFEDNGLVACDYVVSAQPVSFHIPMHRILASLLHCVCSSPIPTEKAIINDKPSDASWENVGNKSPTQNRKERNYKFTGSGYNNGSPSDGSASSPNNSP